MSDMTSVIAPKVDELTADHLLAGPITIRITEVNVRPGTERPVTINYENDQGLPFKPCKSVSRIFVAAWGPDASKYVGRSATLYRDPTVRWGGMEVGGIRISHMSDIQRDLVLALTATKGKKTLATVKPLQVQSPKTRQTAEEWAAEHISAIADADSVEQLDDLQTRAKAAMAKLATGKPDLHVNIMSAYQTKRDTLAAASVDDEGDAHEPDQGDEA